MRKVVQISATQDASDDPLISVIALCDDGTVWRTALNGRWGEWKKLPNVPQDDPARAGQHPKRCP